jgi:hypothetical protein
VYRHNLNVSLSPRTVQRSPSSSTILPISCLKRVAIRDQSRDASAGSVNISRSRTVVGVTFEGIRFVCVSTRELHSAGVRRLEIRWIERGGERVGMGRVWRIGGNGNIDVVDIFAA